MDKCMDMDVDTDMDTEMDTDVDMGVDMDMNMDMGVDMNKDYVHIHVCVLVPACDHVQVQEWIFPCLFEQKNFNACF